jgi:hypothetical protein
MCSKKIKADFKNKICPKSAKILLIFGFDLKLQLFNKEFYFIK